MSLFQQSLLRERKKVKLFLVIAMTGFCLCLVALQLDIIKLEKLLSDESLTVSVDGRSYFIKNGQVQGEANPLIKFKALKLAAFYQWNKEDPIFDSPDFDPSSVASAVGALNGFQKELEVSTDASQNLYPTDFLRSFSLASFAHREFMAKPDILLAIELLQRDNQAAEKYRSAATDFAGFLSTLPQSTSVSYNVAFGLGTERNAFVKILQNASALREEIKSREDCLHYGIGCQRPYSSYPKPGLVQSDSQNSPRLLDPQLIFKESINRYGQFPIRGPYRADTSCFGWGNNFTTPEHYFYLGIPQDSIEPYLATDIFFRRIPPNTAIESEREYFNKGYKYLFQPSDSFYLCPDTGYLNELSEVDSFLQRNRPILQSLDLRGFDMGTEAVAEERSFFSAKYPSYKQLDILADFYGYLYQQMAETDKDPGIKNELLRRRTAIKSKLAYLSLFIQNHSKQQRLEKNLKIDSATTSMGFVYAFRNDYSLFYLIFSPSVWRLPDLPIFLDKRQVVNAVSPQGGYISYSQAKKIYSQEEIGSWFVGYDPILNDLLKSAGRSGAR